MAISNRTISFAVLLLLAVVYGLSLGACSAVGTPIGHDSKLTGGHLVGPNVVQDGNPPDWVYFPTLNPVTNTPSGITIGPDGNVWFTESVGHSLVRITMFGAQYPIVLPPHYLPGDLAVGSDGKFYMNDYAKNAVDKVTIDGLHVTQYVVSGSMFQNGITEGPDHNIWYTRNGYVGKIAPGGKVTQYAVSGDAVGITSGPDGNVWFTVGSAIDRIIPSTGAITSFPVSPGAVGIVTGPDGNLWFTSSTTVGKMTPSGVVTNYPTSIEPNFWITVGPDGALWFTGFLTNVIGRVTTSGQVSYLYPLAGFGGDPSDIIAGPDGNIWFTDLLQAIGVYVIKQISVNPTGWIANGGGQNVTATVAETNYTGTWTAVSSNPPIATVAQGTNSNQFVITSVAHGRARIEISDNVGNRFDVSVSVH
jgi:streptogramin lyase